MLDKSSNPYLVLYGISWLGNRTKWRFILVDHCSRVCWLVWHTKIKIRPEIKNLSFHMCFGFLLALSYCVLMYHCYDAVIAISQGFITLWAGVKEKHHHGISLKIHVSNISPRCPVPWKALMEDLRHRDLRVFGLHDFRCLFVLSVRGSSLSSRTSSFALLRPSWLAHWEALHEGRVVAEQACVFRGSVILELLLFPMLETGN